MPASAYNSVKPQKCVFIFVGQNKKSVPPRMSSPCKNWGQKFNMRVWRNWQTRMIQVTSPWCKVSKFKIFGAISSHNAVLRNRKVDKINFYNIAFLNFSISRFPDFLKSLAPNLFNYLYSFFKFYNSILFFIWAYTRLNCCLYIFADQTEM